MQICSITGASGNPRIAEGFSRQCDYLLESRSRGRRKGPALKSRLAHDMLIGPGARHRLARKSKWRLLITPCKRAQWFTPQARTVRRNRVVPPHLWSLAYHARLWRTHRLPGSECCRVSSLLLAREREETWQPDTSVYQALTSVSTQSSALEPSLYNLSDEQVYLDR